MKVLYAILFVFIAWTGKMSNLNEPEITESVRGSLRNGNAHSLASHFDKTIELIIDADDISFPAVSSEQAEVILRTFFKQYPPQAFQFVYQGASSKLRYCTGTYQSAGRSFAVYVLMRQVGGNQYVINTLHFRKAETKVVSR